MVAFRNTVLQSVAGAYHDSPTHGTSEYSTTLHATMSSHDNSVVHRLNGRRQHQSPVKSPKAVHMTGIALSQQLELLNGSHGFSAVPSNSCSSSNSSSSNGSSNNGSVDNSNTFPVYGCASPSRRNGFHPPLEISEKHDVYDGTHSSSPRKVFSASPRKYASLTQSAIVVNGHVRDEGSKLEFLGHGGCESQVDGKSLSETIVRENDCDRSGDSFSGLVGRDVSDMKHALNVHVTKVEDDTKRANSDAVSIMMQTVFKRPKLLLGASARKDHTSCRWSKCGLDVEAAGMLEHVRSIHVERQEKPGGDDVEQSFVCLWDGCKVYNRPSTLRSWLDRHIVSHLGVRPYPCIVAGCGHRFSSQQALTKHVNAHFGTDVSGFAGTTRKGDLGKQSAARRRKLRECRPCTGDTAAALVGQQSADDVCHNMTRDDTCVFILQYNSYPRS